MNIDLLMQLKGKQILSENTIGDELLEKLETLHGKLKELNRNNLTEMEMKELDADLAQSIASISLIKAGVVLEREYIKLILEKANEVWNRYEF